MTVRSKYGTARWRCSRCGSMFTRIGPQDEVREKPAKCHGCAVKFEEDTNEGLRRDRRRSKLAP